MNASFTDRTVHAAARWYARLQAIDCTPAERAEFARWCAADPANAAAYAASRELAARLTRAASSNSNTRLQAMAKQALVAGRTPAVAERMRRRFGIAAAALAASIVAAFGIASLVPTAPEPGATMTLVHIATQDQTRTLTLDDGSTLHVDVGTDLEVRFGARQREVLLQRGRAIFDVAHDADRPFSVLAGVGRVTAVGTRFQVERTPEEMVVTLAEGIVTVSGEPGGAQRVERLTPGEELSVSTGERGWVRRAVDARARTSWSLGRLVFRKARLADALQEVNRYAEMKVRLADSSLADLPVSGNFVAGDSEAVVAAFAAVLPLSVAGDHGELVVYRRTNRQHRGSDIVR